MQGQAERERERQDFEIGPTDIFDSFILGDWFIFRLYQLHPSTILESLHMKDPDNKLGSEGSWMLQAV